MGSRSLQMGGNAVNRASEYIWIDVEADGFLYNMVRAIAGTLINVGRGYWPAKQVLEILQAEDLLHCTFHPLRNLARATMPEERFHAQFGEDFTAELIKTPEGKATLQAAIDEYFPYLPSFFGGSKSRNNEIFRKWNIKQRTNDQMRQDFMKRSTEVAAKYGLTLPEVRQAA